MKMKSKMTSEIDTRVWRRGNMSPTHCKDIQRKQINIKDRKDPAMHDEVFGPVLCIIKVSSVDEAIEIENASPYGNAACVYTRNGGYAEQLLCRFRAGMLGVNVGIPVPREPFSFGGLYTT